jgi:predicted PhzF superfamily epimerase YddE/YHI9
LGNYGGYQEQRIAAETEAGNAEIAAAAKLGQVRLDAQNAAAQRQLDVQKMLGDFGIRTADLERKQAADAAAQGLGDARLQFDVAKNQNSLAMDMERLSLDQRKAQVEEAYKRGTLGTQLEEVDLRTLEGMIKAGQQPGGGLAPEVMTELLTAYRARLGQ